MKLLDIHTHRPVQKECTSIFNCGTRYTAERWVSIGIHPWEIDNNSKELFAAIKETARLENVTAIGECGIDTLHSTASIELQTEIFRSHALLAEEIKKPLIIHCIKAFEQLIALHKEISPAQAWIIHGFRGKPQLATQLVRHGFHLSYGEKFNPDSVKATPLERIFTESDESVKPIEDIYATIAQAAEITTDELTTAVFDNATRCNILPKAQF